MSEFLFIGGSLDGTVCKSIMSVVTVPISEPSDDPEVIGCGHETYLKRSIEGLDRTFFVFVLTGLKIDDAISMLLEKYRRSEYAGG